MNKTMLPSLSALHIGDATSAKLRANVEARVKYTMKSILLKTIEKEQAQIKRMGKKKHVSGWDGRMEESEEQEMEYRRLRGVATQTEREAIDAEMAADVAKQAAKKKTATKEDIAKAEETEIQFKRAVEAAEGAAREWGEAAAWREERKRAMAPPAQKKEVALDEEQRKALMEAARRRREAKDRADQTIEDRANARADASAFDIREAEERAAIYRAAAESATDENQAEYFRNATKKYEERAAALKKFFANEGREKAERAAAVYRAAAESTTDEKQAEHFLAAARQQEKRAAALAKASGKEERAEAKAAKAAAKKKDSSGPGYEQEIE